MDNINVNCETKSPSEPHNYQIDRLRDDILSCPNIDPDCDAMQAALQSLEEVKQILDMKAQLGVNVNVNASANVNVNADIKSDYLSPLRKTSKKLSFHHQPLTKESAQSAFHKNYKKDQNTTHISTSINYSMNSSKSSSTSSSRSKTSIPFKIFRSIMVDLPLVSFFILTAFTTSFCHVYTNYLGPQITYMKYTDIKNRSNDLTYYHKVCPLGQMSTTNAEDLYINKDFTKEECAEHMMVHGASIYQNIISQETAQTLRDYIVDKNQKMKPDEAIGVIENKNRWSFGIGVNDHPSVSQALKEIATHDVFRPALEQIAGDNPALIEMTAITAGYGATDQFWHPDVISMGSPAKYARNFVPSYALFVTLQDTTAEMGATGVCPGTYMCGNEDATDTCEEHGFQVSGKNNIWKTGDAILMNQQNFHRGAAHVDPNAPHRVVFIITLAPRPQKRGETRMLGQGGSYSLRWDMWGHTLKDLENGPTAMTQPWTTLRALGMYKPKDADWGWDFINQHSSRAANFGTGYESYDDFADMNTVPTFLLAKYSRRMSFREFFQSCTERWRKLAAIANAIALFTYFVGFLTFGLVALAFNKNLSKRVFSGMFWTTIRLIVLYALVASTAYYIIQYWIADSIWAKEISNGSYFYSPFVVHESDEIKSLTQRPAIVINQSDVFITDRFNAKYLHSLVDTLKYSPGNMQLTSVVKGATDTFHLLSVKDKASLARTIANDTIRNGSNFVVLNDDTEWVSLSMEEAESYVANELYMNGAPLVASLDKEADFLLSFYRYGYVKSSIMARKHSSVYTNALMDTIFEKRGIPVFKILRSNDKMDVNTKQSSRTFAVAQSEVRSVSTFKRLGLHLKLSDVILNDKRKQYDRVPTALRSQFHDNIMTATPQLLREGDIVEAQYKGIHNEWYKGKIIEISQGSIIDVQYADGDTDHDLDSSNLKVFKPYAVGERVEVDRDGDFFTMKVVKVLANQKLAVKSSLNGKTIVVTEDNVRRSY
jgi:hypothetical protein